MIHRMESGWGGGSGVHIVKLLTDKMRVTRILIRPARGVLTQVLDWLTMPKPHRYNEIGRRLFVWMVGGDEGEG